MNRHLAAMAIVVIGLMLGVISGVAVAAYFKAVLTGVAVGLVVTACTSGAGIIYALFNMSRFWKDPFKF